MHLCLGLDVDVSRPKPLSLTTQSTLDAASDREDCPLRRKSVLAELTAMEAEALYMATELTRGTKM